MRMSLAVAALSLLAACGSGTAGSTRDYPNPGEPNDSIATATPFTLGTPVVATISSSTDRDYYAFTVPAGGATVNVRTFDEGGTSCDLAGDSVDTFVDVYDGSGNWIDVGSAADDSGVNRCEDFDVALAEGTNYVAVSGYPPYPFVYTLEIRLL